MERNTTPPPPTAPQRLVRIQPEPHPDIPGAYMFQGRVIVPAAAPAPRPAHVEIAPAKAAEIAAPSPIVMPIAARDAARQKVATAPEETSTMLRSDAHLSGKRQKHQRLARTVAWGLVSTIVATPVAVAGYHFRDGIPGKEPKAAAGTIDSGAANATASTLKDVTTADLIQNIPFASVALQAAAKVNVGITVAKKDGTQANVDVGFPPDHHKPAAALTTKVDLYWLGLANATDIAVAHGDWYDVDLSKVNVSPVFEPKNCPEATASATPAACPDAFSVEAFTGSLQVQAGTDANGNTITPEQANPVNDLLKPQGASYGLYTAGVLDQLKDASLQTIESKCISDVQTRAEAALSTILAQQATQQHVALRAADPIVFSGSLPTMHPAFEAANADAVTTGSFALDASSETITCTVQTTANQTTSPTNPAVSSAAVTPSVNAAPTSAAAPSSGVSK